MSWPVAVFLLLTAAVVLPLAAPAAAGDQPPRGSDSRPSAAPASAAPTSAPASDPAAASSDDRAAGEEAKPSARSTGESADRKLEERIARLERVVDDLVKALKASQAPGGLSGANSLGLAETRRAAGEKGQPNASAFGLPEGSSDMRRLGLGGGTRRADHRLAKTFSDGKLIVLVTPGDATSEIVAFSNENGAILWKSAISGRADGFAKSDDPANKLSIRFGNKVHALDLKTGKLLSTSAKAGGAKPEPIVRIFPLKFAKASAMAEHVRKIYPTMTVSVDERTNAIVASGSEESLGKLADLLRALDAAADDQ
jgi:hypothetical protein